MHNLISSVHSNRLSDFFFWRDECLWNSHTVHLNAVTCAGSCSTELECVQTTAGLRCPCILRSRGSHVISFCSSGFRPFGCGMTVRWNRSKKRSSKRTIGSTLSPPGHPPRAARVMWGRLPSTPSIVVREGCANADTDRWTAFQLVRPEYAGSVHHRKEQFFRETLPLGPVMLFHSSTLQPPYSLPFLPFATMCHLRSCPVSVCGWLHCYSSSAINFRTFPSSVFFHWFAWPRLTLMSIIFCVCLTKVLSTYCNQSPIHPRQWCCLHWRVYPEMFAIKFSKTLKVHVDFLLTACTKNGDFAGSPFPRENLFLLSPHK